jgi:hypothetical protein
MPVVTLSGTPFDDIVPELQEALDVALAGTLMLTQGNLAKANPKDTGRMASSWFIGQNSSPKDERPEEWSEPGKVRVEVPEYTGKINFKGNWFISNNLEYAEEVALRYSPRLRAAQAPANWFTAIADNTGKVFNRQFDKVKP